MNATPHLIDELPYAIVHTGGDRTIRYLNRSAEALFGTRHESVIGMQAGEFFARYLAPRLADEPVCCETIAEAIRSDRDIPAATLRFADDAGSFCEVEYASVVVRDGPASGGRIDTYRRIRRVEQASSPGIDKTTLISALESAPYAILLLDADGRSIYANRTFTAITIYSIEDVPDLLTWFTRVHPNPMYRAKVLDAWNEQIIRNRRPGVFSVVCGDGRVREIEIRSTDLEGGATLLAMLDITERSAVEEQLKQATGELEAVIDAFPDLYLRVNFDSTILEFRAGEKADLSFSPQVLLGRKIREILPQEDGQAFLEAIARALEGETITSQEFSLRLPDGRRCFEARIVPLRERQLMVILRDITERRRAEEELRRYREHLEDLVEERTLELDEANQQLRRLLHEIEITERRAAEESLAHPGEPAEFEDEIFTGLDSIPLDPSQQKE
ncbi:PAS domain-containing protein [Methanoculleus taiwanensis]|uniref:PAS domain-containing protein n=1 Tax=Methanoculleus taiwanensis TaxID=1550565 RepID=UPI0013E8DE6F|nr:PAS domain-containing protein [Methanoculleus taiwanensis]